MKKSTCYFFGGKIFFGGKWACDVKMSTEMEEKFEKFSDPEKCVGNNIYRTDLHC